MKRKNVDFVAVIVLALGFTLGSASLAEKFYAAKFMDASEAKQKWGVLTPNAMKFKKSSEKDKGAMSASVIDRKLFVGQDMLSIREQFGDPDSYFFSDTIYAYMISANVKPKQESWELVFIPDADLHKVADVKIHKKCCYEVPALIK